MKQRPIQLLVASLLVWAGVMTYKCPCPRVMSCHLKEFFLTVGAAVALITYEQCNSQ